VHKVKVVDLGYPRTVCSLHTAAKDGTTEYTQICHPHCHIVGITTKMIGAPGLQQCSAMNNGVCKHCQHDWRTHMHITFELQSYQILEDDEIVIKQLKRKQGEKISKEDLLCEFTQKIKQLQDERNRILDINAQFASFLKENAITAFNDDLAAYLEFQINEEKERSSPNKRLIESLDKDLQKYKAEVAAFEKAAKGGKPACGLDKFSELVQELYDLPHCGKEIKETMDGVLTIYSKYDPEAFKSCKKVIQAADVGKIQRLMAFFITTLKGLKKQLVEK